MLLAIPSKKKKKNVNTLALIINILQAKNVSSSDSNQ